MHVLCQFHFVDELVDLTYYQEFHVGQLLYCSTCMLAFEDWSPSSERVKVSIYER